MLVSRRGLLRAGLFGTAAVWMGGALGCDSGAEGVAGEGAERWVLSASGEEILRAVSPVVLAGLLPEARDERDSALEAGIAGIDHYIAHLSLPLQQEILDLFSTLDLWPVRALLIGSLARWSEFSPEALESFFRRSQASRVLLLRRVGAVLQSLVVLSFFDQPNAWKEIGYPGPPITRPDAERKLP
ncbi:MAG: hypothetical protein GY733_24450 [bacterium]|nr:hypothetical protein [bacterium]